jgi:hypothetical protein
LRWKLSIDELKKHALGMLTGSQASLVIKEAFAGWRELLLLLRQESMREVQERMREEFLRLKMQSGDAVKRSMMAMMGGQSDLLLKNVVTNWRDELVVLRQERMVKRLKEENLRLKGKSDESLRRTISMMVGAVASLTSKEG